MSYVPHFMRDLERFRDELAAAKSPEARLAFRKKWLDTRGWPRRTPEQIAQASRDRPRSEELGGRSWGYTSWAYDLTAEARYEYFAALASLAGASEGDLRECPHCELFTTEPGGDECPRCGRRLLRLGGAD